MSTIETLAPETETTPHDQLKDALLMAVGRSLSRLMASGQPLPALDPADLARVLSGLVEGGNEADARDVFGVQAIHVQKALQLALAEHGQAFRATIRIPENEADSFADRRAAAGHNEIELDKIRGDERAAYDAALDRAYQAVLADVAETIAAEFAEAARRREERAAALADAPAMREKLRKAILAKLPALRQEVEKLADLDAKLGKRLEAGNFRRAYVEPLSDLERDLRAGQ